MSFYYLRFKGSVKAFSREVNEWLGQPTISKHLPLEPGFDTHFKEYLKTDAGLTGPGALAWNLFTRWNDPGTRQAMESYMSSLMNQTALREPRELYEYTKLKNGHEAVVGSEIEFPGVENLLHGELLSRLTVESFAQGATFLTPEWLKKVSADEVTDKRTYLRDNMTTIKADWLKYIAENRPLTDCGAILGQNAIVRVGGVMISHIDGKIVVSMVLGTLTTHPLCGINIWSWWYDPKRPDKLTFFNTHLGKHPGSSLFDFFNNGLAKHLMPTTWLTVPIMVAADIVKSSLDKHIAEHQMWDIAKRRSFFRCADAFSSIGVFLHEAFGSPIGAQFLTVKSYAEWEEALKNVEARKKLAADQGMGILFNDRLLLPGDVLTGARSSPAGDSFMRLMPTDTVTKLKSRVGAQAHVAKSIQELAGVKTKILEEVIKEVPGGAQLAPEDVYLDALQHTYLAAALTDEVDEMITRDVADSLLDELEQTHEYDFLDKTLLSQTVQDLASQMITEEILDPSSGVAQTWVESYYLEHFFLTDPKTATTALTTVFDEERKAAQAQLEQIQEDRKKNQTNDPEGIKFKELQRNEELAREAYNASTEKLAAAEELRQKLSEPQKLRDQLKQEEEERKRKFVDKLEIDKKKV